MKRLPLKPWQRILLHVIVPAGMTIALFAGSLFYYTLPRFKSTIYNDHKFFIKEIMDIIYTLAENYQSRVDNGELTLQDAQSRFIARLRAIRYGPDDKDYFWINDLEERMIMHPYRPDLEGQDLTDFRDQAGHNIFLDFNKIARQEGSGFVEYLWQWQDDPKRVMPKISYVRLFEPWGWVIGTGFYIEEMQKEINQLTRDVNRNTALIFLAVALLCGYLVWHEIGTELRRQEAEQDREKLMQKLFVKNEELQSLVYAASHDLRSPLINIQGFSKELVTSCGRLLEVIRGPQGETANQSTVRKILEEEIPEALEYICMNTEKMQTLVSGLLQLSRIGTAKLNFKKLDMNALVSDVISTCGYQIKNANAEIQVSSLPPARGDYNQVNQVFTNLIDNSLKYHQSGRQLKITIAGRVLERQVEYTVSDNGIGIAEIHLDRIFELFHQLKSAASAADGVGLGLTIVKRILDIHNGSIRVESKLNQGSTFFVTLPKG